MQTHFIQNSTNKLIVTLHGTGGDARDLFNIATFIDPDASLLGIQGDVFQYGQRRYFIRNEDGTFDIKTLEKAVNELIDIIRDAKLKLENDSIEVIIIGYSNGANVVIHALKQYANLDFDFFIGFHPSLGFESRQFKSQIKGKIFITYGDEDPYIKEHEFKNLLKGLDEARIEYKIYQHQFGHQLLREEIIKAKEFIEKEGK